MNKKGTGGTSDLLFPDLNILKGGQTSKKDWLFAGIGCKMTECKSS